MKTKSLTMLFVMAVFVSFFAASILPSVNALTARTDFSDRHSTASFGNSHVCGDHMCKFGEQSIHAMKMSDAQRSGIENLQKIRNSAEQQQIDAMHKMPGNMNMVQNATGNGTIGTK